MDRSRVPGSWIRGVDRAALIVLIAALAALTAYLSVRWWDRWYHNDVWAYLQRDWSLTGLLRPHAGHPAPLNIFVTLLGRDLIGFEATPLFPILRAVTWVAYLGTLALVMAKQGVNRVTLLAVLGLIAVWPLAAWQEGWLPGNPVVHASTLAIGLIISTTEDPSPWLKGGVSAVAALMAVNMSSGTIFAFALVLALLVTRKWRNWIGVVVAVPITYLTWRMAFSDSAAGLPADLGGVLETPIHWARLLVAGTSTTTGLPELVAIALIVIAAGMTAVGIWKRGSMTTLEATLVIASFSYVAAVLVFRIDAGLAEPLASRYQYNVFLLFLALVLPHLRLSVPISMIALTLAAGFATPANVQETELRNDFWIARTADERQLLATVADLLRDGEPFLENAAVGAQPLRVGGLIELMGQGLAPELGSAEPMLVPEARGHLQMVLSRRSEGQPDRCAPSLSLFVERGETVVVSAVEGEASLLTSAQGDAILPIPGNSTFAITPLFDEPIERVRITGTNVCADATG